MDFWVHATYTSKGENEDGGYCEALSDYAQKMGCHYRCTSGYGRVRDLVPT